MIFKGLPELSDINEYRKKALKRKERYYEENGISFNGVNPIEWDFREAIERVYELHGDLPYVEVIEEGDLSKARETANLSKDACSDHENGCYHIYCPCDLSVKIGRYIGFIFAEPLSEERLKRMKEKGIKIPVYKKSIYEFPAFAEFSVCKKPISDYMLNMAVWFVALHEFAHIINGHNDLAMAVRYGDTNITLEQNKALEIHADMVAAELIVEIICSWQKYVGVMRKEVQLNGKNPGITYCDEIAFAALSAYLGLRSFLVSNNWDKWTIDMHRSKREKHPLTELRMAVVFNCFLQGLSNLAENEDERKAFMQRFADMVIQFEEFLFQNSGEDERERIYFSPTELIRTDKGKEYYHEIFDAMLELNDILERYTDTLFRVSGEWIDYPTLAEDETEED